MDNVIILHYPLLHYIKNIVYNNKYYDNAIINAFSCVSIFVFEGER